MGLKDLHLRFKAFRLRRFVFGDGRRKKREGSKPSWMTPISHGYQVVEAQPFMFGSGEFDSVDSVDSVVVQREQIGKLELWFFEVSDSMIGDFITKHVQSHFFDRKPKESQIWIKGKETMRKAYLGARAKIRETRKPDEELKAAGSVSVMVINGEKLVIANMGEFKAVLCKDGVAYQINGKRQQSSKRRWHRRLFSVRILALARNASSKTGSTQSKRNASSKTGSTQSKSSELVVGAERVDSDTEFVILGSIGIWETMKHQEAVNLIRHLEDPQEAAECLAKEAINRMSKSNISCLVIRFD
ncbi:hypothetical protein UlMin_009996 [Ulmus minor]